ncbi:hypothetical protein FFI87_020145 [Burkholderia sp. KBS0801]|nr:hypothetical protein FFI87_020145 [Burkholderia sp. KBS0801]
MPAPDKARKTPVGNRNLGNDSPLFFECAIFMLPLGISLTAESARPRRNIRDESVPAGSRGTTSVYSWMNCWLIDSRLRMQN